MNSRETDVPNTASMLKSFPLLVVLAWLAACASAPPGHPAEQAAMEEEEKVVEAYHEYQASIAPPAVTTPAPTTTATMSTAATRTTRGKKSFCDTTDP